MSVTDFVRRNATPFSMVWSGGWDGPCSQTPVSLLSLQLHVRSDPFGGDKCAGKAWKVEMK